MDKNNKEYILSNRNYKCDYSFSRPTKIDMRISGKYLAHSSNFVIKSSLDSYPSRIKEKELEQLIKDRYKIKNDIILGNGSNALLQNIIKILFSKCEKANLVTPFYTFDQAEYGVTSFNCKTKRIYCDNCKINLEKIERSVDKTTKLVYICNPNNPTGEYIESSELIKFAKKVKSLVVVDESSIEFSDKKSILDYNRIPGNLFVLRTFSKAFGLANVRVGFLVCSKKFKKQYQENVSINSISGFAYDIALERINDKKVNKNIRNIIKERNKIIKSLKSLGIQCVESDSNLIFTKTIFKKKIIDELYKNDVSVIPIYDENKKLHLRIAVQDEKTNRLFIKRLSNIIEKKDYII